VLVAAVLGPEEREDGELEVVRLALEQLANPVELGVRETEDAVQSLRRRDRAQAANLACAPDGPRPPRGSGAGLAYPGAVEVVETRTLGDAWLETVRRILEDGVVARYDSRTTKELALTTICVAEPDPHDALIASLGDSERLDWMRRNFNEPDDVPELGGARSYARRLRDHGGRDQLAWVTERLRADPEARDAAITTFEPLTDATYVPCVSLLDFWRPEGGLELVVYAHSLDFGTKAYGNLVELARLQHEVAGAIGAPVGRLVVHAKSAHVYEPEWEQMRRLVAVSA